MSLSRKQFSRAEEVYEPTKKNPRTVPLNYLEKIDAEAAEKIRKENDKKETTDDKS